jgi:hypothetical protein
MKRHPSTVSGQQAQEELNSIIKLSRMIRWASVQTNPSDVWIRVQLAAALRLIRHFFGKDWYNIVFRRIDDPTSLSEKKYLRFVRRPRIHPLSEWFWSGSFAEHARIVRLGEALKILGIQNGSTNLRAKLKALRSEEFSTAYFELKIASMYVRNGFRVEFITPPKLGGQRPDFKIAKDGIETVVECKKRSPVTTANLTTKVQGVLSRLAEAIPQIAAISSHGIVCIELPNETSKTELEAYSKAVLECLRKTSAVSCVILTWESDQDHKDAVSVVTEARGIPNPIAPCPFEKSIWCNPAALRNKASSLVELGQNPLGTKPRSQEWVTRKERLRFTLFSMANNDSRDLNLHEGSIVFHGVGFPIDVGGYRCIPCPTNGVAFHSKTGLRNIEKFSEAGGITCDDIPRRISGIPKIKGFLVLPEASAETTLTTLHEGSLEIHRANFQGKFVVFRRANAAIQLDCSSIPNNARFTLALEWNDTRVSIWAGWQSNLQKKQIEQHLWLRASKSVRLTLGVKRAVYFLQNLPEGFRYLLGAHFDRNKSEN